LHQVIMADSKLLQLNGILCLVAVGAHLEMGLNALGPVAKLGLEANTALTGWKQGCFLYAILGLNDLRLATLSKYSKLDGLMLAVQGLFHAYSLYALPQPAPKALSAVTLLLLGGSQSLKA